MINLVEKISVDIRPEQWARLPKSFNYSPFCADQGNHIELIPNVKDLKLILDINEFLNWYKPKHTLKTQNLCNCDWQKIESCFINSVQSDYKMLGKNQDEQKLYTKDIFLNIRFKQSFDLQPQYSFCAVNNLDDTVDGCIIINKDIYYNKYFIRVIFVNESQNRHGIASYLLYKSASALIQNQIQVLNSSVLLGNAVSMAWHWKNRFKIQ